MTTKGELIDQLYYEELLWLDRADARDAIPCSVTSSRPCAPITGSRRALCFVGLGTVFRRCRQPRGR